MKCNFETCKYSVASIREWYTIYCDSETDTFTTGGNVALDNVIGSGEYQCLCWFKSKSMATIVVSQSAGICKISNPN